SRRSLMTRSIRERRAWLAMFSGILAVGCSDDGSSPSIDDGMSEGTNDTDVTAAPLAGGLCTAQPAQAVGRSGDPARTELSGLGTCPVTPGAVWARQDTGTDPSLFDIGVASGERGGRVRVDAPNAEWEDMTTGVDGSLLFGDAGDNQLGRREGEII